MTKAALTKKTFNWGLAFSFHLLLVHCHHGTGAVAEVFISLSTHRQQAERETGPGGAFETSKPTPSDSPPSNKPHSCFNKDRPSPP